jgi:hypothetical protein
MRMAEGRLVIRKLAQYRAVELLQKGLDYREPPRMCRGRGIYAPGFSSSPKIRGGILVLARTNVRRRGHGARAGIVARRFWHFSDVFEVHRCYFPRNDPRSALGIPQSSATRLSVKNISGNRKKKVTQKQKKWRDDLHGKS